MNKLQPNFEKVKQRFYEAFSGMESYGIATLLEHVATGKRLGHISKSKEQFEKDLNNWLDALDIRCVGQVIDILISKGKARGLPSFIKLKKFSIDYNNNGFMDLIES